jgi:hypothetical protein
MCKVLAAFVVAVALTFEHRRELLEHRQLPETYLEGRFASGEPARVAQALHQLITEGLTEDDLRQAHLLDQQGQPQPYLVDGRILIAYLSEQREVFHIRAHKMQAKGVPLEVFGRECLATQPKRVVIVEGEFGAAALIARDIAALAVPGVSSFIGNRYEDLLGVLRRAGVIEVVVSFDSENKIDERLPSGESNERYKTDVNKRYDVQRCAIILARRLSGDGISATIATLPESWRDDSGKADIDGALKQGCTVEELQQVFSEAVDADVYLGGLSEEAQRVVRHSLCEGEARLVGGVFKLRWGRLHVEARPAGRRDFAVVLFDNHRPVYTEHGRLATGTFRKRFATAATARLPAGQAVDVELMLEALALATERRPRAADGELSGATVQIGSRRAIMKEDGLWLSGKSDGQDHPEHMANFNLELIEDRLVDDGIEPRREIVGVVEGPEGRSEVILPAAVLGSASDFTKALFEQLGSSINLYGRGSAEVVLQVALESSQPLKTKIVKAHGWGTGEFCDVYMTPSCSIGCEGAVDLPGLTVSLQGERIAERLGLHWIDDEELRDLGRHLVDDFLAQHHRCVTLPLLGHVFLAPVIGHLGPISWPLLELRGPSGTRKSTLARGAQSLFGNFVGENALETWRSTPNAIQRSGYFFKDALFAVDDYKGDNITDARGARAMLQLYADRGSRGRLHRILHRAVGRRRRTRTRRRGREPRGLS